MATVIARIYPKDMSKISELLDEVVKEFNEYYEKLKFGPKIKIGPFKLEKRVPVKKFLKMSMKKVVGKKSAVLIIDISRDINPLVLPMVQKQFEKEVKKLLEKSNIEYEKIDVMVIPK